jgi:hypothetical protein
MNQAAQTAKRSPEFRPRRSRSRDSCCASHGWASSSISLPSLRRGRPVQIRCEKAARAHPDDTSRSFRAAAHVPGTDTPQSPATSLMSYRAPRRNPSHGARGRGRREPTYAGFPDSPRSTQIIDAGKRLPVRPTQTVPDSPAECRASLIRKRSLVQIQYGPRVFEPVRWRALDSAWTSQIRLTATALTFTLHRRVSLPIAYRAFDQAATATTGRRR